MALTNVFPNGYRRVADERSTEAENAPLQDECFRKFDKMTQAVGKLTADLSAEREARQKEVAATSAEHSKASLHCGRNSPPADRPPGKLARAPARPRRLVRLSRFGPSFQSLQRPAGEFGSCPPRLPPQNENGAGDLSIVRPVVESESQEPAMARLPD